MCRCNFCQREFGNSQGAKAHLRTCQKYHEYKEKKARANVPSGSATCTAFPETPQSSTDLANPFAGLTEQILRQCAGPDEATRVKDHRNAVLMTLCSDVIDWYRPQDGVVTPDMAVAAKVAILDELGTSAIETIPQTELTLRATAIRNAVLAPYFRAQKQAREREQELRQEEGQRVQKQVAAEERRSRRKAGFVALGVGRALHAAKARDFPHHALVMLEWEVGERLNTLLVGDETEQDIEHVIEASLDRPLLQWGQRLEHARVARRERMINHCLTASLPIVNAALPWMQEVIVKKVCETFGVQPSPAASEAREATETEESPSDEPAPCPVRRRRKASVSPNMDPPQTQSQETVRAPAPPEPRRATS
jgi:hypothetical protein